MKRYNPYSFYSLGSYLAYVVRLPDDAEIGGGFESASSRALFTAHFVLWQLLNVSNLKLSDGCIRAAATLRGHIESLSKKLEDNSLEPGWQAHLRKDAETFQTVFHGECEGLQLYIVPQILGYDTDTLIEAGERLIPSEFHHWLEGVPSQDIRSATRSLAFDLPTASAFHIARATEGVMRLFHRTFIGPLPKNHQQQTFGQLVKDFTAAGLSPALVANLTHIKEHYRNPISHPELIIAISESHVLLTVYVGAIINMLDEMQATGKNLATIHPAVVP